MPGNQGTFVEITGDHVQRGRGTQRQHAFLVALTRLVHAFRLVDLLRHHRIQAAARRLDRVAVGPGIPVIRHAYGTVATVTHACEPIQFGNGQSGRRGHETHHADAATSGTAQPMPIILKQRHERVDVIVTRAGRPIIVVFVIVLDGHAHSPERKTKGWAAWERYARRPPIMLADGFPLTRCIRRGPSEYRRRSSERSRRWRER